VAAAPAAPSVTNVIIQQPMQPMGYGGGMGYGQPMGGGGGGGMGLLIGVELAEAFVKEQQRAAMLKQQLATQQQLGADQAAIQGLQRQLAEQSAKVDQLAAQKNNPPAVAPAAAGATEEQLKMQLQLMQNQKDLEQLRAAK